MMETLYTLLTEKRCVSLSFLRIDLVAPLPTTLLTTFVSLKSLPENAKIPTSPDPNVKTGTVSITPSRSQTRAAGSGTQDGTQGSEPIRQTIQNQPSIVIDDAKVTPL